MSAAAPVSSRCRHCPFRVDVNQVIVGSFSRRCISAAEEDVKQEPFRGRGRAETVCQQSEVDLPCQEVGKQRDKALDQTAGPFDRPYNNTIGATREVQGFSQPVPIGFDAARVWVISLSHPACSGYQLAAPSADRRQIAHVTNKHPSRYPIRIGDFGNLKLKNEHSKEQPAWPSARKAVLAFRSTFSNGNVPITDVGAIDPSR